MPMRFNPCTLLTVLALANALFVSAGCTRRPDDSPARFTRVVDDADVIILHEGLPHPRYEKESLEKERTTKAVRQIDKYFFYREPLPLNAGDDNGLKRVLGDASTFEPFEGEKKCGGFHPDYAVEIRHGSSMYYFLICFGCGEIKVVNSNTVSRFDMSDKSRAQLATMLKSYQKNRPPREPDAR
jgi:hypothetical protein